MLRPREGHDLRVERMHLRLEPAHRLMWIRDVFGNSIALVDWLEPADVLTIVSDVTVERLTPFPGARPARAVARAVSAAIRSARSARSPTSTSRPPILEDAAPLQAWLRSAFTPDPDDAEGTMLALCGLVFRTVKYQRRSEKGVQNPARTLELGTGSCRDMATLMMEAARLLGVAARFASGYLHCTASMAGHASTHAWAEVYLPTLGWRGFDPDHRRRHLHQARGHRRQQSSARRDAGVRQLHRRARRLQDAAGHGENRRDFVSGGSTRMT